MRIYEHGLRSAALILAVLLVVYTLPLSAAEGIARATSIGQVSANGAVDLRGVRITGDGTLFSGDRMNVGSGAYAKVALGAGPKIEVGSGSDVTVTREADSVQVKMASGNVAFKGDGKAPIHVRVGAYEVTVPGNASGNVAYVGKEAFGVRVLTGSVSVRNTLTKQSFSVQKGSERLVSLQTGDINQPLARLASSVPSAIPALPQGTSSTSLSKGAWIALLGTVAGAATAIIVLTTRNDDTDDDAATRLAQVKAVQNLNSIAATANQVSTAAATVTATANAAQTAINNSTLSVSAKAALTAQVTATTSAANSAAGKIVILQTQIATLNSQIASQTGGPTAAQLLLLSQLNTDLNSARTDANNAINSLNSLLTSANNQQVGNLPSNPNLQQIPGATISSASVPE